MKEALLYNKLENKKVKCNVCQVGCFVYIGNVPRHPGEHTYWPNCKVLIVRRDGFYISEYHIKDGACGFCGRVIEGRF